MSALRFARVKSDKAELGMVVSEKNLVLATWGWCSLGFIAANPNYEIMLYTALQWPAIERE